MGVTTVNYHAPAYTSEQVAERDRAIRIEESRKKTQELVQWIRSNPSMCMKQPGKGELEGLVAQRDRLLGRLRVQPNLQTRIDEIQRTIEVTIHALVLDILKGENLQNTVAHDVHKTLRDLENGSVLAAMVTMPEKNGKKKPVPRRKKV